MIGLEEIRRRLDGYLSEIEEIDEQIGQLGCRRSNVSARAEELEWAIGQLDPAILVEAAETEPAETTAGEPRHRRSVRQEVLDYLMDISPDRAKISTIANNLIGVRERQIEAALQYWLNKGVVDRMDGEQWFVKQKGEPIEPVTVEPEPETAEAKRSYPRMPLTEGLRYMLEAYGPTGATWEQLDSRGVPYEAIEGAVTAGEVVTGERNGVKTYRLAPDEDEAAAAE